MGAPAAHPTRLAGWLGRGLPSLADRLLRLLLLRLLLLRLLLLHLRLASTGLLQLLAAELLLLL
jgi:hypothetical protein